MLKLKLQYFGHLMWRRDSLEKTLMLGKIEGSRRRGWQRMRWLDGITDSMDMNLSKLPEWVMHREAWSDTVHRVAKIKHNWVTELNWDCSTPGFPVLNYLQEFSQIHIHWVSDAIQPSHPLSSPSPPAFNLSKHQGLFQWVNYSHQVAKILELQNQSFQWIFRVDFL